MLKFSFILIGFLFLFNLQAQQVTHMKVTQEGDNVVITYDISRNKPEQTFDIKVECSTDSGNTFSINPKSLTGDLKGIKAGTAKRIVWDVLSERQELAGDQFVFQITATYSVSNETFTDNRDGHVYKWVKIGDQVWMAENLVYKTNNGSWAYDNNESNVIKYGRLYNCKTARNVSPRGWHLPTDAEWTILNNYLGGEKIAGGKLKEIGTTHWQSINTGATNETGFTAIPGGYRIDYGAFNDIGSYGSWWSSSESISSYAWYRTLSCNDYGMLRNRSSEECGFSVRCVRDY